MKNETQHKSYLEHKPLIELVRDTMRDDLIKKNREVHLQMPSALKARASQVVPTGLDAETSTALLLSKAKAVSSYDNLAINGLMPQVVADTLNQIIGVFFTNELTVPEKWKGKDVTNAGLKVPQLMRNVIKGVCIDGRKVLVVDKPTSGGDAYIAEYSALSLDDWDTDINGNLSYIKLYEGVVKSGGNKGKKIYRKYYLKQDGVYVLVMHGDVIYQKETKLPTKKIPVIPVGSIDISPDWDEIPLLKQSEVMRQYFRVSCYYYRAIFKTNDHTTTASGLADGDDVKMASQGEGDGAFWATTSSEAKFGLLETKGLGLERGREALQDLMQVAKDYGLRFISGAGEAAEAVRMQREMKLMSINTVAESCSHGVTTALNLIDEMNGNTSSEDKVEVNLPDTTPLMSADGVKMVKLWGDVGLLPDEVAYNQQKIMGAFKGTSIKSFEDFKKAITDKEEV